jgi:hypothetical protein
MLSRIFPAGTVEKDEKRVRKSYIPVHIQNEYSHSISLEQQTTVGRREHFLTTNMAIFNLGNHIYMDFRLQNMNPASYFRVCNLRSIPVQQNQSQYFSTNKYKHRSCSCVHFYEFVYLKGV